MAADLASWQLLQRSSDGRYNVGSVLRQLGGESAAEPALKEWAPQIVLDLCAATGMRARFGLLDVGRVTYIEKRPGPEPVTSFSLGATLPAHASAAGKAILAFSSSTTVWWVAQNLTAFTPQTLDSPARLSRALRIVRSARAAVAKGELSSGQSDVAVPVFGFGGTAIAALELEVQDLRANLELAKAALAVAASGLSRQVLISQVIPSGRPRLRLAPTPPGGGAPSAAAGG
jgi:DNA-binding IclR family transcriptional regulator